MKGSISGPEGVPVEEPVGIVGLGLMGGSVARALKALPRPPRVLASSRDPADLAAALQDGAADATFLEPIAVIQDSRTLVFAAPVGAILALLHEHEELLHGKDLVTDVGSLKVPVLRAVEAIGIGRRFVGAHPMAGGERSGFGGSRGDLFLGSRVWLAEEGADGDAREKAEGFWTALGGEPGWMDPAEHDRRMAWCSHLPQLVSNALAGALDAAGYEAGELGPGGRDMVRLAGSSPEIWRDLLQRSTPGVGLGLESVSRALQVLANLLARRDFDAVAGFMERTRKWREEG